MANYYLLLFVLGLLLLVGWIWIQWGHPVLYERGIPPQEIDRWGVLDLEEWSISSPFYELTFQGKGVVGFTAHGPTVLVLLGEGKVHIVPEHAQRTGRLVPGPPPKLQPEPLPEVEVPFARGYLRLSPGDPAWPQGPPLEDPEAQQEAQALHAEKLPRYLSAGDRVRIPQKGVRVLELETEEGPLLVLDSPKQTAVYWIIP